MRWLVLKWHGSGMRWSSQLWFENDGWVWIYQENERGFKWVSLVVPHLY